MKLKSGLIRNATKACLVWLAAFSFCFQPIVLVGAPKCECSSDQTMESQAEVGALGCCSALTSCCAKSNDSSNCCGSASTCCSTSKTTGSCECDSNSDGCQCEDCKCKESDGKQSPLPAVPTQSETQSQTVVVSIALDLLSDDQQGPSLKGPVSLSKVVARTAQQTCVILSRFTC